MNWKTKSLIQRICSALPVGREEAYYFLQRNFGELRYPPDPLPMLKSAAEIFTELHDDNIRIQGRRVMEVGTGRRIDMPLAFFLSGAESVKTVDLNRYLKPELALASARKMAENRDAIVKAFSAIAEPGEIHRRLDSIAGAASFDELLRKTNIEYHAPADATKTSFGDGTIDLQFSFTVFEHIPSEVLVGILKEFNRLASPEGIACHHVDLSDHFSHADKSIGPINFLQFEEEDWENINSNQFAYHNRLRVTGYESVYSEARHELVRWKTYNNEASLAEIKNGFQLAKQFQGIDPKILTTTALRVFSKAAAKKDTI